MIQCWLVWFGKENFHPMENSDICNKDKKSKYQNFAQNNFLKIIIIKIKNQLENIKTKMSTFDGN